MRRNTILTAQISSKRLVTVNPDTSNAELISAPATSTTKLGLIHTRPKLPMQLGQQTKTRERAIPNRAALVHKHAIS